MSQYSATRPGEPPLRVDWLDLPSKFVQQAHAYWTYTGDDTFGAEVYPALVRTMTHLLSLDVDGDGIPDAHGWCTTYDAIAMVGAASYVAALLHRRVRGHGRLRRGVRHRRRPGPVDGGRRPGPVDRRGRPVGAGRGFLPPRHGGPFGAALLADALCGQRYAARDGLPDVLDPQRMASHLGQAYRLNVLGVAQAQMGAVNAVDRHGRAHRRPPRGERCGPEGTYFTASLMHAVGAATGRSDLVANALTTGYGVYRTTYEDDATAFWFDTPALWIPAGPRRPAACTGPPAISAVGRRGSCWWPMKDPFPAGWKPSAVT